MPVLGVDEASVAEVIGVATDSIAEVNGVAVSFGDAYLEDFNSSFTNAPAGWSINTSGAGAGNMVAGRDTTNVQEGDACQFLRNNASPFGDAGTIDITKSFDLTAYSTLTVRCSYDGFGSGTPTMNLYVDGMLEEGTSSPYDTALGNTPSSWTTLTADVSGITGSVDISLEVVTTAGDRYGRFDSLLAV